MNQTKQTNKFTRFLRNHAAILLIAFCVIAIATVVLAVTLTAKGPDIPDNPVVKDPTQDPDDKPDQPVIKDKVKVYFSSPVDYKSVGMTYTDNTEKEMFVFNSTLQCWKTHHGADLIADDGAQVLSMYDGTVVEVTESYGMGNIVKIDHGDNVVATYASLGKADVVKGQAVKKGDKIGTVSTSASYEFKDGPHLHLEVTENGKYADPMKYVTGLIFREVEAD